MSDASTVAEIAARYGLEPLPVEGGLFRQTWRGPADADGRPAGTAILVLLTPDSFSALHRLPVDEIWHFYRGDPVELLLLAPDGTSEVTVLDTQLVVPAGTWMGARVADGGAWSLCGTTMAPGFLPADYEGGDVTDLTRRYPRAADHIRALCRPDRPLRMDNEETT
ncbi:MAG TPA: cupin domain-containing protein [Pseudonocardiaceae bacterium]|nr:cupin domain-containing protein [Pseudonocardiaceae bacterium]